MQLYTVYFIWKLLYIFRVVQPPIIRSAYNCIYSIWYLSHGYCYLPRTTFMCLLAEHLGALTSCNPQGLSRPVKGLLYLCLGETYCFRFRVQQSWT